MPLIDSKMLHSRALSIMKTQTQRPRSIVYDADTDWDDVNDCNKYFQDKNLAEQPENPDFMDHCECLSFFSAEAYVYFCPAFIAAALQGSLDDRDEIAIRVRMKLKERDVTDILPQEHSDLINDFLLFFDAEVAEFK